MKLFKILFISILLIFAFGYADAQKVAPVGTSTSSGKTSGKVVGKKSNSSVTPYAEPSKKPKAANFKSDCDKIMSALYAPITSNWGSKSELKQLMNTAKAKYGEKAKRCLGSDCEKARAAMSDYILIKPFNTKAEFEKIFLDAHVKFSRKYPDCFDGRVAKKITGTSYQEQIKKKPTASPKDIQFAMMEARQSKGSGNSAKAGGSQTPSGVSNRQSTSYPSAAKRLPRYFTEVQKDRTDCKKKMNQKIAAINKRYAKRMMDNSLSYEKRLEMLKRLQNEVDQVTEQCVEKIYQKKSASDIKD